MIDDRSKPSGPPHVDDEPTVEILVAEGAIGGARRRPSRRLRVPNDPVPRPSSPAPADEDGTSEEDVSLSMSDGVSEPPKPAPPVGPPRRSARPPMGGARSVPPPAPDGTVARVSVNAPIEEQASVVRQVRRKIRAVGTGEAPDMSVILSALASSTAHASRPPGREVIPDEYEADVSEEEIEISDEAAESAADVAAAFDLLDRDTERAVLSLRPPPVPTIEVPSLGLEGPIDTVPDGDPALAHGVGSDDGEHVDVTIDPDEDDEDDAEVAIGPDEDDEDELTDEPAEITEVAAQPPAPPATAKSADGGAQRPPPPPPSTPARKADGTSIPSGSPAAGTSLRETRIDQKKRRRFWWEDIFSGDFLRTLGKLTPAQITSQGDFIENTLGVEKGASVLDVGCGGGTQATELALRGYDLMAMDLSLGMLSRAAEYAQSRSARLNFLHADMREMEHEEAFDAAYCVNTTFGYFDDETNVDVIHRFFRALKPGGTLLLDVHNRDYALGCAPSMAWYEADGCVCMEETSFHFIKSRLQVKRTLLLDDGRQREVEYTIRLYSLHELGQLLHQAGFRIIEVSGSPRTPGAFFGPYSPQLIILAQKPTASDKAEEPSPSNG